MSDPNDRQGTDLRTLVDQAEQLQMGMNLFCSRATAARVTLPQSLHDAAAALLLLPGELRDAAKRSEGHAAFRAGVRRAAEDTTPCGS